MSDDTVYIYVAAVLAVLVILTEQWQATMILPSNEPFFIFKTLFPDHLIQADAKSMHFSGMLGVYSGELCRAKYALRRYFAQIWK